MTATLVRVAIDQTTLPGARFGIDSPYPELVWLPVMGPSTYLLWRHLAASVVERPRGAVVHLDELAASLGLSSQRGDRSSLMRALRRGARFGVLRRPTPRLVLIQPRLPPVPAAWLSGRHPAILTAHHRSLAAPTVRLASAS